MDNWVEKYNEVAATGQDCGVCIWNLANNSVVADMHLSRVFDLPFDVARHGLPIERYIAKTHPDDRPKVARALHDAILDGRAYRQEYRLLHGDGTVVNVVSFAQCFPDENGIASQYVGVVFALPDTKRHASSENTADPLPAGDEICGRREKRHREWPAETAMLHRRGAGLSRPERFLR